MLIWSFFRDAQGNESGSTEDSKGKKLRIHYCLKCATKSPTKTPWSTTFTTNAKSHLLKKHEINIDASKLTYKGINI